MDRSVGTKYLISFQGKFDALNMGKMISKFLEVFSTLKVAGSRSNFVGLKVLSKSSSFRGKSNTLNMGKMILKFLEVFLILKVAFSRTHFVGLFRPESSLQIWISRHFTKSMRDYDLNLWISELSLRNECNIHLKKYNLTLRLKFLRSREVSRILPMIFTYSTHQMT